MDKSSLTNIKIATKALLWCLIPFGMFYLFWILVAVIRPEKPSVSIFPEELSYFELTMTVISIILLVLTIVLPVIVLKREIQKKKDRSA